MKNRRKICVKEFFISAFFHMKTVCGVEPDVSVYLYMLSKLVDLGIASLYRLAAGKEY